MHDNWPLLVVVAGLPTIRDTRRTVTSFERGEWHELGLLGQDATLRALTHPAAEAGRPFDPDAAEALASASGGYPYAIQVLGHHAWRASVGADHIDLDQAKQAQRAAYDDLVAGLYASRWHDASGREQEHLLALAQLFQRSGHAIGSEVAAHLGASSSQVSYLRDRLLHKGTVFAEGPELRFLAPGMADWILQRDANA